MIEVCQLMSRLKSGILPILGLKLAILATFLKILTSNLFCPAFTIRLIGKPNKKSVGPKITSVAPKSHINGHISIRVFSKVSVTKRLITSATINIIFFHDSFCSCQKTKFLRNKWARIFDLGL